MSQFDDVVDRYLQVWNETDSEARAEAAASVFAEDVSYVDPLMAVTGRQALVNAIGAVHLQSPGFAFRPSGAVDGHHDQVRFGWELGRRAPRRRRWPDSRWRS